MKPLKRMKGEIVTIESFGTDRTGKIVGAHSEFFRITGLVSYIIEFSDGSRDIVFPNEIKVI